MPGEPVPGARARDAITPAPIRKTVMVVGGGPAGLEAARVAAERGHRVVLYEKERKLGGSLPVASLVKGDHREDLLGLSRYLGTQVRKAGVEVHTGTAATAAHARDLQPDVILLAAGGRHEVPDIPGIRRRKVLTGEQLHHLVKLALKASTPSLLRRLAGHWLPLVGKDVVVMGGRLHGCQTAEFLVHCGRRVTIVDTGSPEQIGDGLVEVFLKPYLLYWLADHGVEIISDARCEEVTDTGLVLTQADGTRRTLPADTIVTALPLVPNAAIHDELAGCAPDVREIGDAHEPGLIFHAIAAGAQVGREI